MKRAYQLLVIILLSIVTLFSSTACSSSEYRGANSPEQVIADFINALSNQETQEELWRFCPSKWMAERYNMEYAWGHLKHSGIKKESLNQNKDPKTYLSAFQRQLIPILEVLISGKEWELPAGLDLSLLNLEKIVAETDLLVKQIKGPIQIIRIDPAYDKISNPNYEDFLTHYIPYFQADHFDQRVALVEYEGKTYMAAFTLIQYDGKWYIQSLTSVLAQWPTYGGLKEISRENYEKRNW